MNKYIKFFGITGVAIFLILSLPRVYSLQKIKRHVTSNTYQDGDIIFQSSNSRQCKAVKLATHSDISHCGMLFNENGDWFVLEAVEPVQVIPLFDFVRRGEGWQYTIKRMKTDQKFSETPKRNLHTLGDSLLGKHYDIYFGWTDDEMYCSELVWKLYYQAAGIELCKTKKLRDFDLTSPFVVEMMKERYGNRIPYDEAVVAPSDIFFSDQLELVESH